MHLSVEFRFSVDVIYDGYWSWIPSSMEVISIQGDFSFVVFSALVKLLNGYFEKKKANGALEQHWTKHNLQLIVYMKWFWYVAVWRSHYFRDSGESCSACAFFERARIIASFIIYIYNGKISA